VYLLIADLDVLQGEAAEGCGPLGVQENEQPNAIFGFEGVVVK